MSKPIARYKAETLVENMEKKAKAEELLGILNKTK